jgi:transposase
MTVASHHSPGEIQQLMKAEREVRRRLRLQAVHLAQQGFSANLIGQTVGVSERAVKGWIRRYNTEGLAGLEDRLGRGRRSRLTPAKRAEFERRLQAPPQPDDGVCTFRGLDLQRILKEEHQVEYCLSMTYHVLHQMGYSSLMPRPQHRQADPVQQEAFKKTSPHKSKRSKNNSTL